MSSGQFIIFICCYILSLVTCLILMIVGKNASDTTYKRAFYGHLIIAFLFLLALFFYIINDTSTWPSYVSLAFVCSGVALSGLIFRSKFNVIIKSYFGIFAASFLLFVSSPSTLFTIITKGKFKVENYDRFNIVDNYFLDKQSSFIGTNEPGIKYKIVQKLGYFNKTISRDIEFKTELDSIKTLKFEISKTAILRGYSHHLAVADSTDVVVDLSVSLNQNEISSKPKTVK